MTKNEKRCLDLVEHYYKVAEDFFSVEFDRAPITFSTRMTHTAGYAIWKSTNDKIHSTELRFSKPILELNPDSFLADTPGHEVAHLIAGHVYGCTRARGHKGPWKRVMELFGLEPEVTHNMEIPKVKVREFLYAGDKVLTIIRHNKLQRGKVSWYQWKDGTKITKGDFITEL